MPFKVENVGVPRGVKQTVFKNADVKATMSLEGIDHGHYTIRQLIKISLKKGKMFVGPQKAIQYSVNDNDPGRHKSFTHIEHLGGAIGREGLVQA